MQLRLSCGLFSFAVSSLKISISIGVLIIIRISSCLSSNGVAWSDVLDYMFQFARNKSCKCTILC